MKSLLIAGAALAVLLNFSAALADAETGTGEVSSPAPAAKLENSDVLDMVKAALPEKVIRAKVQGSPGNFDTSPASLDTQRDSCDGEKVRRGSRKGNRNA